MKQPSSTGSTVHVNCRYLQWNLLSGLFTLRRNDVDNKRVVDNFNVAFTFKKNGKHQRTKDVLLLRSLSVSEYTTPYSALLFLFQSNGP